MLFAEAALVFLTLSPVLLAQNTYGCFGKPKDPKSKNPLCGGSGTLGAPSPIATIFAIQFDDCAGRCGTNVGFHRCNSLGYNSTTSDCVLYTKILQNMQFTPAPKKNDMIFYNKGCLNITCGPYCSFSTQREPETPAANDVVVDGSFENLATWNYSDSTGPSNECDENFQPYDGIGFGEFRPKKNSKILKISQESTYKLNKSYTFRYLYRVGQFDVNKIRQFCILTPFFSGESFGSAATITGVTGGRYSLVELTVSPRKKAAPRVIEFRLECSKNVLAAQVALDKVSMIPIRPL